MGFETAGSQLPHVEWPCPVSIDEPSLGLRLDVLKSAARNRICNDKDGAENPWDGTAGSLPRSAETIGWG